MQQGAQVERLWPANVHACRTQSSIGKEQVCQGMKINNYCEGQNHDKTFVSDGLRVAATRTPFPARSRTRRKQHVHLKIVVRPLKFAWL